MRIHLYAGPSRRLDSDWLFLYLALDRLPGVEVYLYECHGRSELNGPCDLSLVMDHDLELFGEEHPSWQPPCPFTLVTSRPKGEPVLWYGATSILRLLPAAEPLLWTPGNAEKISWDVAQYGLLTNDVASLDAVFRAFPSFSLDEGKVLELAVARCASGRVIVVDDRPRRLIEALCLGKPVVARRQLWHADVGLLSGVHYWAYDTPAEAREVVAMTIANEHVSTGLSTHGRAWVMSGHTWMHRAACDVLGRHDVTDKEMQRLIAIPLRETSERDRELGMPLLPVRGGASS